MDKQSWTYRYNECERQGEVTWHVIPLLKNGETFRKDTPLITVETDCSKFSLTAPWDGIVVAVNPTAIDEPCGVVMEIESKEYVPPKKKTKMVMDSELLDAGDIAWARENLANVRFNAGVFGGNVAAGAVRADRIEARPVVEAQVDLPPEPAPRRAAPRRDDGAGRIAEIAARVRAEQEEARANLDNLRNQVLRQR